MADAFVEDTVELAAIEWLKGLGYTYVHGSEIAPDGPASERASYDKVILEDRFKAALARLNPHLPQHALDEAFRQVMSLNSPALEENNLAFHRLLTNGVEVVVSTEDGDRGEKVWLIDFPDPKDPKWSDKNDYLVVNQFTIIEDRHNRRPDLVVFINGLPVAVIELKHPGSENATIKSAWNQLQTYKAEIPSLFNSNEILVISDGGEARVGSLTAGYSRFGPWRSVDGAGQASDDLPQLQVVLEGLFQKERLLDYLRYFILWETEDGYIKKIAGYHQFYAARKAVRATVEASSPEGDRRIGVVWHTQGSGKSVSMAFFAGKVIQEPAMENPTVVVITDRNDLDDQLFGQFCRATDLLRQTPVQAESREHLREQLQVAAGGVVFTTMQKLGLTPEERETGAPFPTLSERRNIVVIADEAHRTQYEFSRRVDEKGKVSIGLAKNLRDALPNASFIGFTGTPIEFEDKSTRAIFGDEIDTYTMSQAVEDKAVVPILYEARLAKIGLRQEDLPHVDEEFEDVTEGQEDLAKEKLKSKWAKLEALVGDSKRLGLVAKDILAHYDRRCEILEGKAIVVCMSRRIAADLYKKITKLRPEWHSTEDDKGAIKVVITGSASDPKNLQAHLRPKRGKNKRKDGKISIKAIEKRFKAESFDPEDDPLRMVIVCDMWLTGFDVPCAHTLYLDKPIQGHTLMQAIARVNRVFKDKPSGLVVDYLGLAEQLKKAVDRYSGGNEEQAGGDVARLALPLLLEKFDVVKAMFHGFDYSGFLTDKPTERVSTLTAGVNFVCALPNDGKTRFLNAMIGLNRAAALALHLEEAAHLHDELAFFQAVQRNIQKYTVGGSGSDDDSDKLDAAIKQIISGAITTEKVVDIFGAAGLKKPDISILSDEFLASVQASPHKNLQVELLRKLLGDELKAQRRRNVVQARKFSELLERTLLSYQNRTLEAAEVITRLIKMAQEMRESGKRGEPLGLSEDEMAFYDALVAHGGVKEVMGDDILAKIAHDLVEAIRASVTIDWTQKESVRARLRSKVKRLLRKHGYPPDKRQEAVDTVIEQAEQVCRDWAVA